MNPDQQRLHQHADQAWESSIIQELMEYIEIPNKSPAFDPDWYQHGYMEQAVEQFVRWANNQNLDNYTLEVVRLPERTPLIYIEIDGQSDDTVLLYGHLDKQPEMSGWRDDLAPFKAVLEGERLYGRGGADDGYAMFASLTAIQSLQQQSVPHARCVVIIEACEESGSYDLPLLY